MWEYAIITNEEESYILKFDLKDSGTYGEIYDKCLAIIKELDFNVIAIEERFEELEMNASFFLPDIVVKL